MQLKLRLRRENCEIICKGRIFVKSFARQIISVRSVRSV